MTAPETGTALLILVGFVLPGFVAVLLKERLYEVRGEESTFDRLLTTVYYSLLIYLLPALAIGLLNAAGVLGRHDLQQLIEGHSPLWLSCLLAVALLLVLPAFIAVMAWIWATSDARMRLFARSRRLDSAHGTTTSWDFAFAHEEDLLLVVELKDGKRVAGYYGAGSRSGYGTGTRDLFLQERWEISADDDSITRAPAERRSVGLWIGADDIRLVDHYAVSDEHERDIARR
jgi:hypothetical protein